MGDQIKKHVFIFMLFFLACCFGTLFHELGHYISGIIIGYHPVLQYKQTVYTTPATNIFFEKYQTGWIITIASGIFVNVSIGCLGYFMLIRGRRGEKWNVFYAVLSFFWSREIVNLGLDLIVKQLFVSAEHLSDEQNISNLLSLPENTFSIILGLVGILICSHVVFGLLPKSRRVSFITFGFLGSFCGYLFWFKFLGPIILP